MSYRLTIPGQEKELRRSFTREIAPDVWMLEGYISDYFLIKPASSNVFLLRDGDALLMLDSGTYPFYRERMLELMRRYRADGVKRVDLMLTQGHFDHASNNDVILESGMDWRFLLQEPEVRVLDYLADWMADFRDLEQLYDIYAQFDLGGITAPVNLASRISVGLARSILQANFRLMFLGIRNLSDRATILPSAARVKRRFGQVELEGWEVGRFFAIHDASHTPGHISLYDPENKLLLSGDVTVEINPAFYYSSLERCISTCGQFRRMAEEGYIELATDSHRSTTFFPDVMRTLRLTPFDEIEMTDVARGREECIRFFRAFEDFYSRLRDDILDVHARMGEATIPEITEELRAVDDAAVNLRKAMRFQRIPGRLDVLVAVVLKEAGATSRREGGRVIFSPRA
ncbi:MAG: MBL fold metallo-hydrolase [Actinobacteria bacterium]|jgi:glyoxylase-like metal-dependent hydrolase (beta-lactamase superfamily II)|nr:MAG: MBL fold metallo-hydrolase [Actinomycetota bacterium]